MNIATSAGYREFKLATNTWEKAGRGVENITFDELWLLHRQSKVRGMVEGR